MTVVDVSWMAQDKALCHDLLDRWAQRTGFVAPRAGLIFVEPIKSELGVGRCWIAAMPTVTVPGAGTADRSSPEREILVACLIYVQPGDVPPAGWELALAADFEASIAWANGQSGWSQYHLMHPTPIHPAAERREALWTLEGIQFRLKVG